MTQKYEPGYDPSHVTVGENYDPYNFECTPEEKEAYEEYLKWHAKMVEQEGLEWAVGGGSTKAQREASLEWAREFNRKNNLDPEFLVDQSIDPGALHRAAGKRYAGNVIPWVFLGILIWIALAAVGINPTDFMYFPAPQ